MAFFKETATPGDWRVSLRSKGAVDVGAIARRAAAAATGTPPAALPAAPLDEVRQAILGALEAAVAQTS